MATVNPKTFSIGDPVVALEGDTTYLIKVGIATGGPYTVSSASVLISTLTLNGSTYTGNWSSLTFSPPLANFTTYFAVAEAENAQGVSGGSPEQSFQIATTPAAPTSFSLA